MYKSVVGWVPEDSCYTFTGHSYHPAISCAAADEAADRSTLTWDLSLHDSDAKNL